MTKPRPFQRLDKGDIEDYTVVVSELRNRLETMRRRAIRKRAKLLSKLGVLLLADPATLDEAAAILDDAHALAHQLRHNRLIATNGIRRAMAFQYRGHHLAALQAYDETIGFIENNGLRRLKDYALQHKGKCLVEAGDLGSAARCLDAALHIRQQRGDEDLVASTMRAIEELKRRPRR
jgi:tetratricopeptide (TPR) repeat protein